MTLSGKNCLITGANTGLGLAVSKRFVNMRANTIMLCRNKEKGENAVLEIKNATPNASVELMLCIWRGVLTAEYKIPIFISFSDRSIQSPT
jgi:NAD(P)-dependent dehydrogenase (short-subunit alcohol dehydrogenase family)